MLISQAIFSTGWKYLKSKPSYNKVLQCSLCSLAPPPAKVSGSHQNTSDYAGTVEWAQLDLQSIQHRDYFGHLSISISRLPKKGTSYFFTNIEFMRGFLSILVLGSFIEKHFKFGW